MTVFTWKSFNKAIGGRSTVVSPVAGQWSDWQAGEWSHSICTNQLGLGQGHFAPEETCSCGFYGTLAKDDSLGYGDYLGVVEAAGKIIVHRGGIRAQYARIHAFVGMRFADMLGSVKIIPFRHWLETRDSFLGYPVIQMEQAEDLIAKSCRENGIHIRTLSEYFQAPDGLYQR